MSVLGTYKGFPPIGNSPSNAFNGSLDGKSYVISNIAIDIKLQDSSTYAGLLGVTTNAPIIKNITLEHINIISLSNNMTDVRRSNSHAGGLVGINRGSIFNGFSIRMVSGSLYFSNTTIGIPAASDFAFFYDIEDDVSTISITLDLVQGVTVAEYTIERAIDANGNELENIDIPQIDAISGSIRLPSSFGIGSKFYLSSIFTKGTASFTRSYSFKK